MSTLALPATHGELAAHSARAALGALHTELLLYPKPGLVSLVDSGSHADMNAATFMRSLFALRHYFAAITQAGADRAPFETLRRLGIAAEARMLAATGGVNTHRGAIFSLGVLCAAYGRLHANAMQASAASLRAVLLLAYGEALAEHARVQGGDSHGVTVTARHAAGGAREEAALGLPSVFEIGVPALRRSLQAGRGMRAARVDALFALMAQMDDTNVLYRGGAHGAALVRSSARSFVEAGGTAHPDWLHSAVAIHHSFVAQRLSPGGAADLLAASCFVHALCP
jgi:triphosphoribosyl-dephospho-CoA synthase